MKSEKHYTISELLKLMHGGDAYIRPVFLVIIGLLCCDSMCTCR